MAAGPCRKGDTISFVNAAGGNEIERMKLEGTGNLQIDGDLRVDGNDINLGGAAFVQAKLYGGDSSESNLALQASSASADHGQLLLDGATSINYRSPGAHYFGRISGGSVTPQATLGTFGDLSIEGDFELATRIDFASGSWISGDASSLHLQGGFDNFDDVTLVAGNDSTDGRIIVNGSSSLDLAAGNGAFRFQNAAASFNEIANLSSTGNLQIDGDLTVTGDDIFFGGGARLDTGATNAVLYGGTATTDDLYLYASTGGSAYGGVTVYGGSDIELRAGNGQIEFFNAAGTNTAFVDTNGNWDIAGRLDMNGGDIYMVETGVDQTQDIYFREDGLASGERFEWDNTADRFETSDDMHVFGTFTATTKSFVQNHPYRDDLEVVYVSLEGDEATTFTRGFGRLAAGEARVKLGETFAYVTNPDLGLSVHLTPRGDWADLYVIEVTTEELVVGSAPGAPDVAFDYIVFGLRIGHENFPTLRPKRSESFLPEEGWYANEFTDDPALSDATALARHGRMRAEVHGLADVDTTASSELAAAIGRGALGLDIPAGQTMSVREMLEQGIARADDPDGPGTGTVPDAAVTLGDPTPDGAADDAPDTDASAGATVAGLRRDDDGNVYAGSFRPSASELATMVPAAETVEAGDVLTIDPGTGHMVLSRFEADAAVFGVVAAQPGVVLGAAQPASTGDAGEEIGPDGDTPDATLDPPAAAPQDVPVAMSGIVLCKVDAGYGSIRPGDLLMTSPTPGHAMRADAPAPGTILGKALEPLDAGTGLVRVLVTLR